MPNSEFQEGPSRSHPSRPPHSQNQDSPPSTEAGGDDLGAPRGRSPQLLPISDAAAAYRLVYGRIDALIRGAAEVAELTCRPVLPGLSGRRLLT
jgi:phage tail tape-measure protein